MFAMVTSTIPPDSVVELGEAQVKLVEMPLPSYLRSVSVFAAVGKTGVRGHTVIEGDEESEFEGLKEIHGRMVAFYDIVGFRYGVEPNLTMEEALPFLVLAPPE